MSEPLVEAVAGTFGAMVALTASYPLLTVNMRQQTTQRIEGQESKGPKSAFNTALALIKEEGGSIKGLFKGLKPAIVGTGASQLIYFYVYAFLRDYLVKLRTEGKVLRKGTKGNISALEALTLASVAGAINVVVTSPIWVITAHMQAARKLSKTISTDSTTAAEVNASQSSWGAVAKEINSEAGLAGFWKGVLPSLAMVSNPAIQYMLYEWLKTKQSRFSNYRAPTSGQVFLMGALAKTGATVLTYPMLLVKSRLQAESKHTSFHYSGTWDAVLHIMKTEGLGAFYKGMQTKLVQSVLASALMFTIKEEIDKLVRIAMRRPAAITA